MDKLVQAIESWTGFDAVTQGKLVSSLVIILVLMAARYAVLAAGRSRATTARSRYRWRKTTTYLTVGAGIFLVGRVWFEGVSSLATFLGLLSAGIAISLKDPVANLAGWAFIVWRRPFEIGDRIQIDTHAGDVIDIRIFQFTLLEIGNWVDADQSTGRMIHVPNGRVLSEVVANYSKGFQYIWNEVPVLVTYESNWREAKAIIERLALKHAAQITDEAARQIEEASRTFMIVYNKITPVVYTSVRDSGVLLTARWLCDPRQRRVTTAAFWEALLDEFAKHDDIDLAYPTTRFYDNVSEGKRAGVSPGGAARSGGAPRAT
jgi:small-conductance mechanosensitive channel